MSSTAAVHGSTLVPLRRGSAVAVVGAREELSYDELGDRAGAIAQAILERTDGRPPGAVAIVLDHDAEALAALVGILMAGGHYVVLAPDGPLDRAALVLEDADVRVLLTEARHAETAHRLAVRRPAVTILELASVTDTGTPEPVAAAPSDLAAVLYTSGSSGTPKGVDHSHASLTVNALTYAGLASLGEGDRLSLLHGLGTMACATTMWGGLLSGAALVMCDPRRLSRARLLDRVATTGITGLHLVPTLFRHLCGDQGASELGGLRFVRLGGEPITRADWTAWRRSCAADSVLHVGLATTETGLVRHEAYTADDARPPAVLPLGGPVPGRDVLVVDDGGDPVRTGETGRIVVRARHMFSGYHGRPHDTASVRDIDPRDGTARFFSGDLAWRDAGGRLFHAGRVDAQIKIAGHRIEPAEIEQALRDLLKVRDAAVVARPDQSGVTRLAAFVVPMDDAGAQVATARGQLRGRLPAHMIPATVETTATLPLLAGGKVDRGELARRPVAARPPAPAAPPCNPVQETLLEIARRVLVAPEMGVETDLFTDLGADSLDAVQILSEVADLFGCELGLQALVGASTVATLATRLLDGGWSVPGDGTMVVNPDGLRPPVFALCGVYGHALRLLLLGRALGEQQPFYGLQPPQMDWAAAGCETIEEMAAHYAGVMRRIQPHGPYQLLGTSFGGLLAFTIAQRLERDGEDVALLAMIDTPPPDTIVDGRLDRAPAPRDFAAAVNLGDPLEAMGARVAAQHARAFAQCRLAVPFRGRLVYLRCAEPAVPRGEDRRGLWSALATGGFEVVPVPGWHGSFHREPQFSAVVAELRRRLAKV